MKTTNIAGREVPIQDGSSVIITFSGGEKGPEDAGTYEFWILVMPPAKPIVVRQRAGDDPGERFRRMEFHPKDKAAFERAKKATDLRVVPGTREAAAVWLDGHLEDAKYIVSCEQGGKPMKVSGPPYRLEPK